MGDGLLETYNEPRQIYVYISCITGKSCSIQTRYYMPRFCWMVMLWDREQNG